MSRKKGGNFYAALMGSSEPEAVNQEIAEALDRRKNGAAAAAAAEHSSDDESVFKHPLVWIDLEMTGLQVEEDTILQIACIVTDGNLERQAEGPEITIYHPEEVLQNMNDWCKENHGKSGLTQAVRESTISLAEAEQIVLEFVQRHIPEPGTAPLAGNSVHVDMAFLKRHMPRLAEHFHYRIVDVSTVGELCRRWFPREYMRGPKKKNTHTALSDIRESVQQLKYYRSSIFKKWSGVSEPRRR